MKSLSSLVIELDNKIPFITQKNAAISQVSVGWHLEHSLLALIKMITAVEHSDPSAYKSQFNLKRSIVLLMGKIPRGKARVPDSVKPGENTDRAAINVLVEKAKQKAELFEKLDTDKYFSHPVFADLRVKQARKIIAIHTIHHLRIINDIIKG